MAPRKPKPGKLTKVHLAQAIEELLDIKPNWRLHYPVEGTKILEAILKTIAAALHRNETISIKGFGKFYVIQKAPKIKNQLIIANPTGSNPIFSPVPIQTKASKIVIFEPSIQLRAMVNGIINPSFKERRAISIWNKNDN